MVSVLGYLLPSNKLISIGLTSVYGINRSRASQICNSLGFAKDLRVNDLRDSQLRDLLNYLSTCNFKLGAELGNNLSKIKLEVVKKQIKKLLPLLKKLEQVQLKYPD